jgi:hypothetical protein
VPLVKAFLAQASAQPIKASAATPHPASVAAR